MRPHVVKTSVYVHRVWKKQVGVSKRTSCRLADTRFELTQRRFKAVHVPFDVAQVTLNVIVGIPRGLSTRQSTMYKQGNTFLILKLQHSIVSILSDVCSALLFRCLCSKLSVSCQNVWSEAVYFVSSLLFYPVLAFACCVPSSFKFCLVLAPFQSLIAHTKALRQWVRGDP